MLHIKQMIQLALIAVALMMIGALSLAPRDAHAVIPLEDQCSTTYDPAKSKCTAVIVTPLRWRGTAVCCSSSYKYYPDETAAKQDGLAVATSSFVDPPNTGCSVTLNGDVLNLAPALRYGIEIVVNRLWMADYLASRSDAIPCQHVSSGSGVYTEGFRSVICPGKVQGESANWHIVWDSADSATPYCACPWNGACKPPCCASKGDPAGPKGNPIEMLTGSKVEKETDYQATSDSPLRFARTYRSDVAYNNNIGLGSARDDLQPFGPGWAATYFQHLAFNAYGSQNSVYAYRPDGRVQMFQLSGAAYVGDDDQPEKLTKLVDGGGTTTGWQFVTANDDTETYDVAGRLLTIKSRTGIVHTLAYAATTSIYPATVKDSFGQQIAFNYDAAPIPKVTSIALPDSSQILYAYDTNKNLTAVTYPDTTVRTHHYELMDQAVNLLTGVTDESNVRFSTFSYEASARAKSTEHAGGVNKYTFTWSNGDPTVIDPLNQSRVYTSSIVQGARRYTGSNNV